MHFRFPLSAFRFLAFVLFLLAVLFSTPRASAQSTVFGGGISITNTSTNSAVLQTNTASVTVGRFYITLPIGIGAGTNALSGNVQFSLDNTNFLSLGNTWRPTSTNAASYTVDPTVVSFPIYLRMSATTTTNTSISALYLSPN